MRFLLALLTLVYLPVSAKSAREAWTELIEERHRSREAYAFVENQADLPNVLLYGDSISIAYTPIVQESLQGVANVYRLHTNGGDSSSVIQKMDTLHAAMKDHWEFEWAVIHFNVGLHDLKYVVGGKLDKNNGTQVSSLAEYETNLRKVIAYFKDLAPGATLIFATTTPVPENEPGRMAGDAQQYNEVAHKVLQDHPDVLVNDLFGLTLRNQPLWWTKPGNVHFTEAGYRVQGRRVARVIRQALEDFL